MHSSRWSPEERSRLYRRQKGRVRRAELEAVLPSILDIPAEANWRLLPLEDGDQLIQDLRDAGQVTAYVERNLTVDRADLVPTVARHAARLNRGERVLVFFHDSDSVGLLELPIEAFVCAAPILINLDGEIISATNVAGTWRFVIDCVRDEDVEHIQVDALYASADGSA